MKPFSWLKHLCNLPCKQSRTQSVKFSSLASVLDFCTKTHHLHQIHARFILHGLHQNPTLVARLMNRYANLGDLDFSLKVFNSANNPNSLLWNTIIRIFSDYGDCEEILLFYQQMLVHSVYPDEFTFPFVMKACSCLSALEEGLQIHAHVVELGFESDVFVGTALIDMYSKCGGICDADQVFDKMPVRNLISWNTIISGFCQNDDPGGGLKLFERMRLEGLEPDSGTLVSLLLSSTKLKCLGFGRFVHLLTVLSGLEHDLSVNTALLAMYSKLGSLELARKVFDNMPQRDCFSWNTMILGYNQNGYPELALELLARMQTLGVRADLFTAMAAISSAAELRSLVQGKQIHSHTIRNELNYQVSAHNSLIDMYSKCGKLEYARNIFNSLSNRSVISWSSMIQGYICHDRPAEALALFNKMNKDGIRLDSVTIINILPACVHVGALKQVKNIHGYSIKHGLSSIISLVTSLLVSYAKCGSIEAAQRLFEISNKDLISWNSMIAAYSMHGDWARCFKLYNRMNGLKVKPDHTTFIGLLSVCANSGLVDKGWEFFNQMDKTHDCQPKQEHYACMVDLLGRMGYLKEAVKLIREMPFKPDSHTWGALLGACKIHSEARLAEFAAKRLLEMEPSNAGNYVLLSNIYAAAGKWDGVARVRGLLRDRGLKKTPGCSWLEMHGQVHEFRVGDTSHPKSEDIHLMLWSLDSQIKEKGSKGAYFIP